MKTINDTLSELRTAIDSAYENGVTMPEAEKLAAMTLSRRMAIADQLLITDIDSRMKKHGAKAVRAAVYMEELKKHEKKPAEAYLENAVNISDVVESAERAYAEADVAREHLENYMSILGDAHVYFRQIAKGNYEG